MFQNYSGSLDSKGQGGAALAIPNLKELVGLKLYTAFLVKDSPTYIGGMPAYRKKCEEVVAGGYEGFRFG